MKLEYYNKALQSTTYTEFASCFNKGCSRCSLSNHEGNYPVLYRGRPEASIALFGEAPGLRERELGKPFTGPAGSLLDDIFRAIGIDTNKELFISNITYCRPVADVGSGKQNYTPKLEQIVRCWQFGKKALELLNPKIIIACGLPAAKVLLGDETLRMGEIEGRWLKDNIFIMRHPASILHQSNYPDVQHETKRKVWEYMKHFRDSYKERL